MFELRKTFTFEASHQLEYHDGKCANLHGHSYTMVVELSSACLQTTGPKQNMVMDFQDISKVVKALLKSHLDHHHLNHSLGTDSPTAEYIAQWTFNKLHSSLPLLTAVEIRETASSSVTYRPIREKPLLSHTCRVQADAREDFASLSKVVPLCNGNANGEHSRCISHADNEILLQSASCCPLQKSSNYAVSADPQLTVSRQGEEAQLRIDGEDDDDPKSDDTS